MLPAAAEGMSRVGLHSALQTRLIADFFGAGVLVDQRGPNVAGPSSSRSSAGNDFGSVRVVGSQLPWFR